MVKEQGLAGTRRDTAFLKHLLQQVGRFGPQGTGPFFASLAAQQNAGRWGQLQIGGLQTRYLANARTGVEHEAQQGKVAAAKPSRAVDGTQHGLDFIEGQIMDLSGGASLEGNAQNPLDLD